MDHAEEQDLVAEFIDESIGADRSAQEMGTLMLIGIVRNEFESDCFFHCFFLSKNVSRLLLGAASAPVGKRCMVFSLRAGPVSSLAGMTWPHSAQTYLSS